MSQGWIDAGRAEDLNPVLSQSSNDTLITRHARDRMWVSDHDDLLTWLCTSATSRAIYATNNVETLGRKPPETDPSSSIPSAIAPAKLENGGKHQKRPAKAIRG